MKQLLTLLIIISISILASCTNQKPYNNNYSSTEIAVIPIIAKAAKYGKKYYDASVRRKTAQQAREALDKRSKQPTKARRFYEKKKSFRMKTAQESRNSLDKRSKSYDKNINSPPSVTTSVTTSPKKRFFKRPIAHLFTSKNGLIIFSIMGSVGFTSFVLEEAEQTCMFGNFTLSKPPQYSKKEVREEFSQMSISAIKHCFKIHHIANHFNNTIGYLYPFGFAYRTYQDANELYLCSQLYKSLKQIHQTFQHAGELGDRCISLYELNQ